MNKRLAVILTIGMITCLLSSCSDHSASSGQSFIETSVSGSSSTETAGTTAGKSKLKQGTDTIITCDQGNLKIKLPDSWKGRYLYDDSTDSGKVFSYTFFSKSNMDAGGILFYFYAQKNENADCYINSSIIGQNDQYVFFTGHATDVEYVENDESKKKDYQEMQADIQGIISDFLTMNHITAFNNNGGMYKSTDDSADIKINGFDVNILYNDPRVSHDIQNKANQTAVKFLLSLCNTDWDAIKAVSTQDFYTNLKNYNAGDSTNTEDDLNRANSLIGKTCRSINKSFYLQKGTNQSVFIDADTSGPNGYFEIHLAKDSNGDFLVSSLG